MTATGHTQHRLCIGLTGGIGCGKSTVAALFSKLGAGIVDTDVISHQLTEPGGAAIAEIAAQFGNAYILTDGAMDRARMRQLVFSDSNAKHRLERILHPLIQKQAKAQLPLLQDSPYIVIVVPLLPESRVFRQMVQRILVVDCSADIQIARVTGRSGMDDAVARGIIAQQTPRAERLRIADDVIHNDGGLDSLAEQIGVLHVHYSGMQNNI